MLRQIKRISSFVHRYVTTMKCLRFPPKMECKQTLRTNQMALQFNLWNLQIRLKALSHGL